MGRLRRPIAAATAALAAALASLAPARAIDGPYIAVSTRIAVKLDQRISSQEAHVGDAFTFVTTSSVEVGGQFLGAGTHGRGVVIKVRPARGARPGELKLKARTLDLGGGATLAVGLDAGELDGTAPAGGGTAVDVAGLPVLIGNAARDNNVVFERGKPFVVVAPPPPTPEPAPSAG